MSTAPASSVPATAPWMAIAVAVAVAVAATSLGNGFAYDDLPIVVDNTRVTTLLPPWAYFDQSYWSAGGLYRPFTVWLLALQWHLGDGAPWIFHVTSVALHALATGLAYLLARRALAPAWAGLAALCFAVHPVHVEAVANVVGVSELLCAVLVLASVLSAPRAVAEGFTLSRRAAVLAFGVLAALSKEQGYVTPALLLATAGMAGLPRGTPAVRKVAPVAGALAALLAALLLFRTGVLGGMAGDEPAAPLRTLGLSERVLASLGTVPHWARLLLWPAKLSFDYTPPGYPIAATLGLTHLVAVLLVGGCLWLAWECRVRAPAVTLGITWTTIALLPVSNLILPTGILLAERTLYLASVGAVLAVAGGAELVWRRLPSPAARRAALIALAVLLLVAAGHSAARAGVWRDNETLLRQVELEAPNNYRAHRTRAQHLDRQGRLDDAAREYRRSIELWGHDPKVYEDLAILLDRQGRHTEAMTVLKDGLRVDPAAPVMRGKLYYLQTRQGDWLAARATAAAGLALGDTIFASLVRRADSVLSTSSTTDGQ